MYLKLVALFLFLVITPIQAKTITILATPYAEDATHQYFVELLEFVLKKSEPEYQPTALKILKEEKITHERTLRLIRNGMIDLSWAGTSEELESVLLPIRIPLLKGLLGSRVSIIHKRNIDLFKSISKEKLQTLIACQGSDWGDSDILESNGYKVLRVARFDLMFKMLNRNRCDYFPRAIFEGYNEIKVAIKDHPDLVIFDDVILQYKFPLYFFVNKANKRLATQLEFGLKKSIEDNSFVKFMSENKLTSTLFPLDKWKDKTVIKLHNTFLPKSTPLLDESLWIDFK